MDGTISVAAPAVLSVFGRTGAVVAASGDYNAAQVTNAVDQTGSYADPPWIISLAWSKIIGAPAFMTDPLTTKGDLLGRSDTTTTRLPVGTNGQVLTADSTQALGIRWATPTGGGGSQTPWLQDIDGAEYQLKNTGNVGIANPLTAFPVSAAASTHLVVGGAGTAGLITAASTNTSADSLVGSIGFANYTLAGADKRVAAISTLIGTTADSGIIAFYTWDAGNIGERMRIAANGYVGINTSNPVGMFQVREGVDQNLTFRPTGNNFTAIQATNDAVTTYVPMEYAASVHAFTNGFVGISTINPSCLLSLGTGVADHKLGVYDGGTGNWYGFGIRSGILGYFTPSTGSHTFYTGDIPAPRVTILNTGLVGINNPSPGYLLEITGGRTVADANNEPYAIGLRYNITSPITWTGCDVNGNFLFSNTAGTPNVEIYQDGQVFINRSTIWSKGRQIAWSNRIGTSYGDSAIEVRQSNEQSGVIGNLNYAPRISFHWPGINAVQIGIAENSVLRTFDSLGTGYATFACGTLRVYGPAAIGTNAQVVQAGDLSVSRDSSPGTGAIFFANTGSHFLYYDGAQFEITDPILVNGACNVTGPGTFLRVLIGNGAVAGLDGDLSISRNSSVNTGAIFFGNDLNRYLLYNGTHFQFQTAPGGTLYINGQTVMLNPPSDIRVKTNIRDLTGGLLLITRLRPREFEYTGMDVFQGRAVSLIAQELQEVAPQAVQKQHAKLRIEDTEFTELLTFNPTEITMHLILAVQQLEQRIKTLEARVN